MNVHGNTDVAQRLCADGLNSTPLPTVLHALINDCVPICTCVCTATEPHHVAGCESTLCAGLPSPHGRCEGCTKDCTRCRASRCTQCIVPCDFPRCEAKVCLGACAKRCRCNASSRCISHLTRGTSCAECGAYVCRTCRQTCAECDLFRHCSTCMIICHTCNKRVCDNDQCATRCSTCDNFLCQSCVVECAACQDTALCDDCSENCSCCNDVMCNTCSEECSVCSKGMCGDCYTACGWCSELVCNKCDCDCKAVNDDKVQQRKKRKRLQNPTG